jgi:mevalonate pyrophosphate decarboxylase
VRISGSSSAAALTEAIRGAGYTPQEVQAEPAAAARTASGCGCGCGCGPQKPGSVDACQAPASAAGSCCR